MFDAFHLAACMYGNRELLRLLLEHGADVNCQDKNGRRALAWPRGVQGTAVVSLLERRKQYLVETQQDQSFVAYARPL